MACSAPVESTGGSSVPHPISNERVSEDNHLRFVGNLSPEASFLATRNRAARGDDQRAEVGVWLGHQIDRPAATDGHLGAKSNAEEQIDPTPIPLSTAGDLQMHRECMSVLPLEDEFGLISNVFFSKFDPIFPILYEEDFEQLEEAEALALKQCICLIAALDPSLKSHLRFHTDTVMSQTEFRSRIAKALEFSLYMGLIRDKMVLLQVSTLLAFYVGKSGSSEISSHYCAQAVQLSQTLGLHLGWPDEGKNTGKSHRIFWCVWTLDRLNAATNGRPTLIQGQDMDERVFSSISEQIPSFRLFILICRFLDQVIAQYRPRATLEGKSTGAVVPEFEGLVREARATEVSSPIMGE
ncbi:hypothetical protein TPAR_04865 [Tolypocladium paradoxum]|uniref:Xylanolytic transcriptional activator regulatory domain-containing protein n=1 Tax=Tolypocladium paradoxum TaxID=94208 RepID=A0A2S4KXQ0_9HYPO|nr:hypothetical protein TPAR_04865 [Tolypocladium paradoxum]